jgi:hypothetical protein
MLCVTPVTGQPVPAAVGFDGSNRQIKLLCDLRISSTKAAHFRDHFFLSFCYSVVISLYSPETHPTWLPIFTACQPLKALATYSSVVPGATAVMRL